MFNWICPKCGSDVLASYSECPNCAKAGANPQAPQPAAAQAAPPVTQLIGGTPPPAPRVEPARSILFGAPPAQQQAPPAPTPQPQQPYYPPQQAQAPPSYAQPPVRRGMPTWLMSILFSLGFALILGGGYYLLNHNKGDSASAASGTTSAPAATGAAAKASPMQKFVEVTGVRMFQDPKKGVEAKFLIVNHSDAEVNDLGGTVAIRARTMKASEEPVGTFKFMIKSLGANDAKEATAPVDTKLKVYELPDWQLVETQVQITSP